MPYLKDQLIIGRCHHCNVDSPNVTVKNKFETNSQNGDNGRYWYIYVCQRCEVVIIAWAEKQGLAAKQIFPST